jgi:hypothetical protein
MKDIAQEHIKFLEQYAEALIEYNNLITEELHDTATPLCSPYTDGSPTGSNKDNGAGGKYKDLNANLTSFQEEPYEKDNSNTVR